MMLGEKRTFDEFEAGVVYTFDDECFEGGKRGVNAGGS